MGPGVSIRLDTFPGVSARMRPVIDAEKLQDTGARRATAESPANLPALPAVVAKPATRPPSHRRRKLAVLVLVIIALAAGGGYYWWRQTQNGLPPGFAMGNGRLEADEIDIPTKFPERVRELLVDEGDIVKAGQVVARMDTTDLQTQLAKAEAMFLQAQNTLEAARHSLDQQRAQLKLAQQQLQRAYALLAKGFQTQEVVDQRQAALNSAIATVETSESQVGAAEYSLKAAQKDAALLQVNISDNTLVAPKDGRILYRLANIGEMLPVGGKVFTMLDTSYVYMDIFLPTKEAGRVVPGAEARIVLDAIPDRPIPATVAFLSPSAQFTPKMVETQDERDKLMFRVRVKIDPGLLRAYAARVRSGLPGVAYVKLDPKAQWPQFLRGAPTP